MAGFLYGQGEEIVYKNSNADYLSQLLWDMKPLFYYGYTFRFERSKLLERPGFFTGLSIKYGIPARTGIMEDRDWLDERDHRLTHFSQHDNFTKNMLLLDVKAGASFPLFRTLVVKAYGTVSFMRVSWESYDGYTQYAPDSFGRYDEWSDSLPKSSMQGRIIDYDQTWAVFGAGFSATLPLGAFNIGLSFDISPFILSAGIDNHWLRKAQFNDYLRGGIFLEPRMVADFSPHQRITLALSVSWRVLIGAMGDTHEYVRYQDTAIFIKKYPNSAGAGLSFFDMGLSIMVKL
jgi:outer membrane protease